MKKVIISMICIVFAAGTMVCDDVFAQRSVNAAQDAAKAAKASLTNRSGNSSSQIGWLDQVVDIINMDDTATKDKSTGHEDL